MAQASAHQDVILQLAEQERLSLNLHTLPFCMRWPGASGHDVLRSAILLLMSSLSLTKSTRICWKLFSSDWRVFCSKLALSRKGPASRRRSQQIATAEAAKKKADQVAQSLADAQRQILAKASAMSSSANKDKPSHEDAEVVGKDAGAYPVPKGQEVALRGWRHWDLRLRC